MPTYGTICATKIKVDGKTVPCNATLTTTRDDDAEAKAAFERAGWVLVGKKWQCALCAQGLR